MIHKNKDAMMEEMQKITSYKSSALKWKVAITITLILFCIGGYMFYISQGQKEHYHYVTQTLKKDTLSMTVSATGNIEPLESIEVGTEISGTIEKIYVDYNTQVTKGQILAQLDKTKYQSSLSKAEASLQASKANLDNMNALLYQANATVLRNKTLKETTNNALPSHSDWDRDWANYLVAKAGVENAKAGVNQAVQVLASSQYDLERTTIYSPIDGIILTRNIDPGQTVAASFQTPILFKIAKDLTKMELQVSIDEADIAKVQVGQKVTFRVDSYPEVTFESYIKLVRVNSEIVDGVVTYKAVMDVDNQKLLLKPGMSADADIVTKTLNSTFIVPKAALLYIPIKQQIQSLFSAREKTKNTIDPKPHLWLLNKEVPEKIYITIQGSNGSSTAISSDKLKEGDPVIVNQEKLP